MSKRNMTQEEKLPVTTLRTTVLYKTDFLVVEADEHKQFIHIKWLQHPDSANFRTNFYKAVEIAIEHKSRYWLSDARAILYVEFADQNWMLERIVPLAAKTSLLKFARLSTLESVAMLDVSRVFSTLQMQNGVVTSFEEFTDKDAAMEWLLPEL